jgi:bacterioferritin-associated ferredoxin
VLKTIFNISMIVCVCKAVSDREVAKAIEEGAETVEQVMQRTGVGGGCGRCLVDVRRALDMAQGKIAKPIIVLPVLAALTS